MKEEPAAAGRGARRRGTPLSILGFRVGGSGGPRGLAGAAVASCFGVARRCWGRRFGRWWLAAQGGAG